MISGDCSEEDFVETIGDNDFGEDDIGEDNIGEDKTENQFEEEAVNTMSMTISEKMWLGFLCSSTKLCCGIVFFFQRYVIKEMVDCSLLIMWILNQ